MNKLKPSLFDPLKSDHQLELGMSFPKIAKCPFEGCHWPSEWPAEEISLDFDSNMISWI